MQGQFVDVDGVRTHYFDQGNGPIIVLLHGASLAIDARATWFRAMASLSKQFRVVALDQIGFGRTDMPISGRYASRLMRLDHVLRFLDLIGIKRATVVGHSEGGFVATRIAIMRPDLVLNLVIVTSGATAPRLGNNLDAGWIEACRTAYDYSRDYSDDEFIALNRHLTKADDAQFEMVMRDNYQRARAVGQDLMFRHAPDSDRNLDKYFELQESILIPYMHLINMPVLLIWASEDATVPVERGIALLRSFRSADMHIFAGSAHMVMIDRSKEFNHLIANWCYSRSTLN